MNDNLARALTGVAVLAVAVIAAVVSYSHIQALALSHGYTLGTARLLPFSVDGLIVASSLALANGARPALARTGLVLGCWPLCWPISPTAHGSASSVR